MEQFSVIRPADRSGRIRFLAALTNRALASVVQLLRYSNSVNALGCRECSASTANKLRPYPTHCFFTER